MAMNLIPRATAPMGLFAMDEVGPHRPATTPQARSVALEDLLRKRRPGNPSLLVGGAIGVGMTAEAAVRGGADFLLALNAGRFRVMGAASLAALLPLNNSNKFTDGFARREILDRVNVPVLFGACCFDPGTSPEQIVAQARETGYHGITNFPSAIHFDGLFRQRLEEAGLGFAREARMLARAREAGLMTFGYAKTRAEIAQLIATRVDMICLNFGWNAGGMQPVAQSFTIAEAADRARRIVAQIRSRAPGMLCFVEGGPIISPDDMFRVCDEARADGYVGGSTLDRMPLEMSVTERTSAFKAFGLLKQANAVQSRELARTARIGGVVGQSEFVISVLEQVTRLAEMRIPVLICGEAGLGRTTLARALHPLSRREGPHQTLRPGSPDTDPEATLFGDGTRRQGYLARSDSTVVIENAETLPADLQRRLADWLEDQALMSQDMPGRAAGFTANARLVLVCTTGANAGSGLIPALSRRLQAGRVEITPLRERPEDVPALARHRLGMLGHGHQISADGYRLLLAYPWPGNIPELRSVIDRAALEAEQLTIGSAQISAAIGHRSTAEPELYAHKRQSVTERDWLLDALRRNRFRRGDTAAYLGISRKTLYNKMHRFGLLE